MKLNKVILSATLLMAAVCANAQEVVNEYVFKPHWFMQAQIGGQETLGEGKFGKLLSGNAQLAAGYKFNPYIGMRLAVNAWQSRGAVASKYFNDGKNYYYRWNYIAPTVDAVVDLTNLIGGYNPKRLVEVDFLAGIGTNYAWNNKGAHNLYDRINGSYQDYLQSVGGSLSSIPEYDAATGTWTPSTPLEYSGSASNLGNLDPWGDTKWRFVGQFGCALNFNVSSRVQVGLELMANVTNDRYNSKKGPNTDWYFNALLGVGWSFGPKYKESVRIIEEAPVVVPEPVIVEKVVEKIVEVPVQVEEKKVEKQVLRRDVFFLINESVVRPQEMEKVAQIADYLKANPSATVTITGYADKGTGSMAYNIRLSAARSQAVAKILEKNYGIPSSRIILKSMGEDMFQPYPDPVQNRVAICIAE